MLLGSWTKHGINEMNLPYRLPVALEVLASRLFQLELAVSQPRKTLDLKTGFW